MGVLAELLAALAVSVLKALLARHDLKASVAQKLALELADLNAKALAWKLAHPVDPHAGGPFGGLVRDDAPGVGLPPDDPGTADVPGPPPGA